MSLKIDIPLRDVLPPSERPDWERALREAHEKIVRGAAAKEDGYGWYTLPRALLDRSVVWSSELMGIAMDIQMLASKLVVLGAGGSFLGAKAVIDARAPHSPVKVVFAGHDLSARGIRELLSSLEGCDFAVNVVSKSGTTTEPDMAFRFLHRLLIERYGEAGARSRIIVTTGPEQNPLRALAQAKGYRCFEIPPDIGGRYSVFTNAGLIPMAVAGVEFTELIMGASRAEVIGRDPLACGAAAYAVWRGIHYHSGRRVEFMAAFEPQLEAFLQWAVQLFAESEGKNGHGILPAVALYTRDLHSLGQYIQQGPRSIFETVFTADERGDALPVPSLSGLGEPPSAHTVQQLQAAAISGTLAAHREGGVPCGEIGLGGFGAYELGCAMQTLMYSCALSATMLGVNPFDQPGVDAYKNNMTKILAGDGTAR